MRSSHPSLARNFEAPSQRHAARAYSRNASTLNSDPVRAHHTRYVLSQFPPEHRATACHLSQNTSRPWNPLICKRVPLRNRPVPSITLVINLTSPALLSHELACIFPRTIPVARAALE